MNQSRRNFAGVLSVLGCLALAGCASQREPAQTTQPEPRAEQPQPERQTPTRRVYRPETSGDQTVSHLSFPTGDERTSAIILHTVMPGSATPNASFNYEYHVTNLTDNTLQNVTVLQESAENLTVTRSNPEAQRATGGDQLYWALGELAPRQTRVIRVVAEAGSTGTAGNCISVSYNNFLCSVVPIVQPELTIAKTATPEAIRCDGVMLTYTVCNTGSGVARNVRIRDTLPQGLSVEGRREINIPVGDLTAGECREFEILADAARVGEFESAAIATADGDLRAESDATVTLVTQPTLELEASAPEEAYLFRSFTHRYTVRNTGDAPSHNTIVAVALPTGPELMEHSEGGVVDAQRVLFNVGTLAAGQEREVSVSLRHTEDIRVRSRATANGDCVETAANAEASSNIIGIPAILMELIDINDPIEVGQTETYVITITNQGSRADTNIAVRCQIPPEFELVSTAGPTEATLDGNVLTFEPLGRLGARQIAEWRVRVRAVEAGDVRFAVEMISDNLTSPVRATEATRLFR